MIEHLFLDTEPLTKRRAIARIVVISLILCVPMGIAIAELVKAIRADGYVHVVGQIIDSELTNDTMSKRREAPYGVVHMAQFDYLGRTYVGTTSAFGTWTSDAAEADAACRKHPVGAKADVWFEPGKPGEIVLDPPSTNGPIIAIGIISAIWIFITWIYFIPQLRRASNPGQPKLARSKVGLRLFFVAGFLVPTIAFYFAFFKPIWSTTVSRQWIEVPAHIVSATTLEHPEKVTLWKTDILYWYEVNGRRYMSNQYNLTECSVPYEAPRRRIVDAYSEGQVASCYVNSADNSCATLTRHVSPSICIGVWVFAFSVLFGIGAFCRDLDSLNHVKICSPRVIFSLVVAASTLAVSTVVAIVASP
jgi:hypothetical protein